MNWQLSDLSNSVFASLGVPGRVDQLGIGESPAGRECFILIDGLGYESLLAYQDEFPIFREFVSHAPLHSHFPSTTATNISSIGTGETAGLHGMLGYTVKVPHSGTPGRLLNALKWDERVDPEIWQNLPTNFQRAQDVGVNVWHIAAKRYEGSGFTRAALRGSQYVGANTIDDIITSATMALSRSPSFAYIYLNNIDHAGHEFGVGSEKWLVALATVSELLTGLCARLPAGVRIWLTADHGMINVEEKCVLGIDNPLMENVELVGGEPRARHMYLTAGSAEETLLMWKEFFGDKVQVLSKAELIASQLLGSQVTEVNADRIGDLIAIPQEKLILIDPARIKQESAMIGHHGGLTETEILIPFLSRT